MVGVQPSLWFWESWILERKFLLELVTALPLRLEIERVLLLMLYGTVSIAVQIAARPYSWRRHNSLACALQALAIVAGILSVFQDVTSSDTNRDLSTWAAVALIYIAAAQVVYIGCRFISKLYIGKLYIGKLCICKLYIGHRSFIMAVGLYLTLASQWHRFV